MGNALFVPSVMSVVELETIQIGALHMRHTIGASGASIQIGPLWDDNNNHTITDIL